MEKLTPRDEIGSEFWDIPLSKAANDIFPINIAWFLSGRSALSFVIEDIQSQQHFRSVAMPSWCCHSMIDPFVSHKVEIYFYPVCSDTNGHLTQDLSYLPDCDGLLMMDYFGYSSHITRPNFSGVVIRDVTHSLFTGLPDDADYVFGSLRKWAGFWTGGYAWKKTGTFLSRLPTETIWEYAALRQRAMERKHAYIQGKQSDKDFLKIFTEAEMYLDSQYKGRAAARDINAAQQLDLEMLRCRRRENAALLLERLSSFALFPKLSGTDCPLFVPILVPDGKRDNLRRFLIEREIYCPVHWPRSPLHKLTELERRIYEEELSLVCDQRYNSADMRRILKAIDEFFKGET